MTAPQIGQCLMALFFPALAAWGCKRSKALEFLGPVVLCYAFGILLANTGAYPVDRSVSMGFAQAAVPLAIPMLLFHTDIPRWLRTARSTVLSFFLLLIAATGTSIALGKWFSSTMPDAWQVAGMLTGVYIGGTQNMSAIGLALGVPENTFVLVNACDIITGSAYLLFLISVAQKLLLLFLPKYRSSLATPESEAALGGRETGPESGLAPSKLTLRNTLTNLGLSGAILGLSAGISFLLHGKIADTTVILTLTTLGIAASFIPGIRRIRGSYEVGEYLLWIFCVALGSMADAREIMNAGGQVFTFTVAVMCTTIAVHFLLSALFRIDADTTIIVSTATIFGPAFIGPVASSLRNREIVVSGITTALVGIATANYIGILVANFLKPG